MQCGEATLPTATPSQTCPSCCASLPRGSLPTGIPQQPRPSRRQRPVRWCLPPRRARGTLPFAPPAPSLAFGLGAAGSVGYPPGGCRAREAPRRLGGIHRRVVKTTSWALGLGFLMNSGAFLGATQGKTPDEEKARLSKAAHGSPSKPWERSVASVRPPVTRLDGAAGFGCGDFFFS